MARLVAEGRALLVRMNPLEVLGALHGPVRVPLASVTDLDATNDVWSELRGLRVPGTGIPGLVALGTWRYSGSKDFVAVYGRSGVVVTLSGSSWSRLLVSSREPRRVCQRINGYR
jgi:hypothetical protein